MTDKTKDLKAKAPKEGEKKVNKAKEIFKDGIESEAQALEYYKACGVKPLSVYKGEAVTSVICTVDGSFFYENGAAVDHARKKGVAKKTFVISVK